MTVHLTSPRTTPGVSPLRFGYGTNGLTDIQGFVRGKLSAYAYPRRVEFVGELPKTLTGKIRRIELRQLELERAKVARN